MGFITELPLVNGKNGLFICISKFSKFCRLSPILLGEGELSTKQVASLFFNSIVRLFVVLSSFFNGRYVHFTI